MRTLAQMYAAVSDNLTLEGVESPGPERLLSLLNSAKNHLVAVRDRFDRNWLTARKDYNVTKADASIELPDGSDVDAAFRRLLGVEWVEGKGEVPVYEFGDLREKSYGGASCYLVREGRKLYFSGTGGAPRDMTLRVRYAALVADLAGTDETVTFAALDGEWCDAIVSRATIMGLPASRAAAVNKWEKDYAERLGTLQIAAGGVLGTVKSIGRNAT